MLLLRAMLLLLYNLLFWAAPMLAGYCIGVGSVVVGFWAAPMLAGYCIGVGSVVVGLIIIVLVQILGLFFNPVELSEAFVAEMKAEIKNDR